MSGPVLRVSLGQIVARRRAQGASRALLKPVANHKETS